MDIKNVSYEVTQNCNFRCKYCYVLKYAKKGSVETGKAVIDWLLRSEISGRDTRTVRINFFGGEPLLAMDVITGMVDYAKLLNCDSLKKVRFSMTSNLSLLTPEIMTYFKDNNINLLASIDGDKETHDKHRVLPDGGSTWGLVYPAAQLLVKNQTATTARMTVSLDTASKMFDNVRFLVEDMGFTNVAPTPDTDNAVWSPEYIEILSNEYFKLEQWIVDRIHKNTPNAICVRYFSKTIGLLLKDKKMSRPCGAGRGYLGISYDGSIYPCHRFASYPEWRLGDVFIGDIDYSKVQGMIDRDNRKSEKCKSCNIHYCGGGCYASNYVRNKDITVIGHDACELRRLLERTGQNIINKCWSTDCFRNLFLNKGGKV